MNGSANLNVMMQTARKAGRSLLKDFGEVENLQVSRKGPGDFVSRADTRAEEIIQEALTNARPTYGWLGEESGETPGKDPTRRWIVDPLDGTANFLHGLPHWAVSIGLEHKDEVIAGVIYDPLRDELFFAEKGTGAWMNQTRLRVSGRTALADCLFATGEPASVAAAGREQHLADMSHVMQASSGLRRLGSAALDMAYVAAGRVDGFWQRKIMPWDIAAGIAIVIESGGYAQSIDTKVSPNQSGQIIASAPQIFPRLVAKLQGG